jgi:hypothetical protein
MMPGGGGPAATFAIDQNGGLRRGLGICSGPADTPGRGAGRGKDRLTRELKQGKQVRNQKVHLFFKYFSQVGWDGNDARRSIEPGRLIV